MTDANYKELVQIYDQYKGQGLEIVAYPCNQFGSQEPGSAKEIADFQKGYGVTFPVMAKAEINGDGADPALAYLRNYSSLNGGNVAWNFGKFLVNKDGDVVAFYNPPRGPSSITDDIEKLLNA